MALRVNEEKFDDVVLNSDMPVLVDFYSDTCVPCKMMAGTLGDLEDEYGDRVKFCKVNVNFDGGVAEKYEVMSAPTLIFFKDGKEAARLSGAKDREEIEALFE